MHLVFDNNYDVYKISNVLELVPHDAKKKNDARINPITQKKNPGYWTIKSDTLCDYDLKNATDNLLNKIKNKLSLIKNLCQVNDGTVVFDFVIYFGANETPAIYFERDFLEIVHYLNAEIQFDLYNCDES